jgi:hypothetical protein
VPADRSSDDDRAALEADGWTTSFRVIYSPQGRAWVAKAVKGDRVIERRGATEQEAWEMVCREAFEGGRP